MASIIQFQIHNIPVSEGYQYHPPSPALEYQVQYQREVPLQVRNSPLRAWPLKTEMQSEVGAMLTQDEVLPELVKFERY